MSDKEKGLKQYIKAAETVECFIVEDRYYELVDQGTLFSNIVDASGEAACYANGYFKWESIVNEIPKQCSSAKKLYDEFHAKKNYPGEIVTLKDNGPQDWGDVTKKEILIKHAIEFDDMFIDTSKKAALRERIFDAMEEYLKACTFNESEDGHV